MSEHWRLRPGQHVDVASRDAASTKGGPSSRSEAEAALPEKQRKLFALQDRLWAEGTRSVLVVLQGTDASGKDGTIRHVFTGLNPQATPVAAFRVPTPLELRHDFLWRVHQAAPAAGQIGIFNRSHYEDVVAARARGLVSRSVWEARYDHINAFERLLSDSGTTVVKFFLHVSRAEQGRRFQERANTPEARWKLRPEDTADRSHWDEFQTAYSQALTKTTTEWAPWHLVPADHKWFRNWVVSTVLVDVLSAMDPAYPAEPPPG